MFLSFSSQYIAKKNISSDIDITEDINLDRKKWHDIYVVVDRIAVTDDVDNSRIASSVETFSLPLITAI